MNALQQLQATAGAKAHEQLFEGKFTFLGKDFPCNHSEIGVDPLLTAGGFSPSTDVTILIRNELFTDGARPVKTNTGTLTVRGGRQLVVKVEGVMSGAGDVLYKFHCKDENQGA